jgi:hypothetical protein
MTAHQSANGVRGHLLYIHCDNKYVFRVYNAEHNFVDYDLLHCDLCVTIDDEDAFLYQTEHGATLDHSPMTLGKTNEENIL